MPLPATSENGFAMKVASTPCWTATPFTARLYMIASSVARSASGRWRSVSSSWPGAYSEIAVSTGIPCTSQAA